MSKCTSRHLFSYGRLKLNHSVDLKLPRDGSKDFKSKRNKQFYIYFSCQGCPLGMEFVLICFSFSSRFCKHPLISRTARSYYNTQYCNMILLLGRLIKGEPVKCVEDFTRWRDDMNFMFEWQGQEILFLSR